MDGTRRTMLLGALGRLAALLGGSASAKRTKRHKRHDGQKNKKKRRKGKRKGKDTGEGTGKTRAADHDALLADLTERMGFGERDEGVPLPALEARLARGEWIEALCGTQSALGVRALQRAGYRARVVGALREPYGPDNSHVMLEVRVGGAWHCYDVMSNTRASDREGNPLSVGAWCAASTPHWQRIASDPNWPHTDAEIADVYARVLGTPWVADAQGRGVFHDPANEARIVAARPWLYPVDTETWEALIA